MTRDYVEDCRKALANMAPGMKFTFRKSDHGNGMIVVDACFNPYALRGIHPELTEYGIQRDLNRLFKDEKGLTIRLFAVHRNTDTRLDKTHLAEVTNRMLSAMSESEDNHEQLLSLLAVLEPELPSLPAAFAEALYVEVEQRVKQQRFKQMMDLDDDFPGSWLDEAMGDMDVNQ